MRVLGAGVGRYRTADLGTAYRPVRGQVEQAEATKRPGGRSPYGVVAEHGGRRIVRRVHIHQNWPRPIQETHTAGLSSQSLAPLQAMAG